MSAKQKQAQAQARDLKHRVLTCLHKLSDRDTHASAASELESIARTLSADAIPSFITSISATDSSDKSTVRRQCIRLVAVLSDHHGNSLSPYLSKVLSAVVRRLRDPDSSVRSACVAASLSLSSQLTSPPFASITKPFLESLFTEQDANTQTGAAQCLAAVVEGSRNPDAGSLRKLMPRLEKLAKCESFKAKAAILALMGSVVGVEGVLRGGGKNVMMKNLIACLMEFLSSEEWAARKAAAEALMKIAVVERDALSEFKGSCLKSFEAKRFDKVKAARETMNQMVEAWKEIPDEVSATAASKSILSKECGSVVQVKKSSPVDGRRSGVGGNGNSCRSSPPMFRKLEQNKPLDKIAHVSLHEHEHEHKHEHEHEHDGAKRFENNIVDVHERGDHNVEIERGDMMICEDLSLIREQLVQIQNQQSNLLHILQTFIGRSQNGIDSLKARVHGLEMALQQISYDVSSSHVPAVSSSYRTTSSSTCCEFIGSKLRWKTSTEAPSSSSISELHDVEGGRRRHGRLPRGRHGLIHNPLAQISSNNILV